MSTAPAPIAIDRRRIRELAAREEKRLEQETPGSYEAFLRASRSLVNGVASSYQIRDPYPIFFTHGKGSKVYSVDSKELSDFHNGFGCMVQGHAHPAIVDAIKKRCDLGTQFGLPTEDAAIVADHLARNFRLPKWRFVNSGTEATMDAIRIARAYTGRKTVLKIFGSYHGHHDYAMVSIGIVDYGKTPIGTRDNYNSLPYGAGIPEEVVDLTVPVPFNDAPMMEARIERLIEQGRRPACLIMEPAMMNLGVILPQPGYLEAVREITRKHGILLIFDEIKTGICTAAGGAIERWEVLPDMVTLAKALAGGLPSGAIGATDEVMEVIDSGRVFQVGTYNGNPLCMAAARASLEEVMTPEAYAHMNRLNSRLVRECGDICVKYGFPGYTVGLTSKGCIHFAAHEITDYESFVKYQDIPLCSLAWLYNVNRGVLLVNGREEEWCLSVQHTDEDVDRYVSSFEGLVEELTA
ncbi:MAG: aspartate aminotransferase family protein [Actinobacteria bacterium]|nr:aspartate aminotransferase family protein [Actinomycetota bacterium]